MGDHKPAKVLEEPDKLKATQEYAQMESKPL